MTEILKIGDVLPPDMKKDYSETMLNVSLEEAVNIAKGEPPSADLSDKDKEHLNKIFEPYKSDCDPDPTYWKKCAEDKHASGNNS